MSLSTNQNALRIFKHIKSSWQHHFSLQFATMIVLVASFTVITGVLSISTNLNRILTLWGESMQMSVYLDENAEGDSIAEIKNFLESSGKTDTIKFVNQEQALNDFREQMSSYAPDLLSDKDLLKFIPASFQFALNKSISSLDQLSVMQSLSDKLKEFSAVEDVSYGQEWVKSYAALTKTLNGVGGLFILIIFASAAFVMANSIQSSIEQRRNEVEVLELIGATKSHIRWPFIWEALFLSAASSLTALGLAYGLFYGIREFLQNQLSFLQVAKHLNFIDPSIAVGLILLAMALGATSSWLCVKKINSGWSAARRMQEEGQI
jgi:cell division transport system permease protein